MPEIPHFNLGENWVIDATFKVSDVPTNPGTCSGTLLKPSGATEAYPDGSPNITSPSTGVRRFTDVSDEVGVHYLEVVGTSPAAGLERFSFVIDPRWPKDLLETHALTSIEAVELAMDQVGVQGSRVNDEEQKRWIAVLINQFSSLVQNFCEREWQPSTGVTASARRFAYDRDGVLSLAPYEAREITGVVMYADLPADQQLSLTEGYTTTGYSWYREPENLSESGTILRLRLPRRTRTARGDWIRVDVTAKWGAGVVPADVKRIVEAEVANAYWVSRRRLATSAEEASYLAVREIGFALSPNAESILEAYSNGDRAG